MTRVYFEIVEIFNENVWKNCGKETNCEKKVKIHVIQYNLFGFHY